MHNKITLFILVFVLPLISSYKTSSESDPTQQIVTFPKQVGLLNDFGESFNTDQKKEIKKILDDFQKSTNKNIVIVSVKSIAPYNDFKTFAVDLGNHWNLKNTALIVFSQNIRKISLSITKDVNSLTDTDAQKIVSETIIPEFRNDKYYEGIKKCVVAFTNNWK